MLSGERIEEKGGFGFITRKKERPQEGKDLEYLIGKKGNFDDNHRGEVLTIPGSGIVEHKELKVSIVHRTKRVEEEEA